MRQSTLSVMCAALFSFLLPGVPAMAGENVEVFRIGACISVSGEFQPDGEIILAGIRMRMDECNANAEIAGVELQLFHRDDESTTEGAVKAFMDLVEKDKVDAVIGPMPTALVLAIRELAAKHEIVVISPWATSSVIGSNNDWCFRILFDDDFQGAALARYIYNDLGLRRVGAIVNERVSYSTSVYRAFSQAFEREGGEMVNTQRYNWLYNEDEAGQDFIDLLRKVAASDPEVIFLPVYTAEVALIIRESLRAGITARFCGGDTWQSDVVFLSAGKNIENAFYLSGANFSSTAPAMKRFTAAFENSHEPYAEPFSVLGYDCLSLLIEGMKNGRDGKSIRDSLYTLDRFELASGQISIDRETGEKKQGYIYSVEKQGDAFVPVLGGTVE